jgi:hypothetical protein
MHMRALYGNLLPESKFDRLPIYFSGPPLFSVDGGTIPFNRMSVTMFPLCSQ